VFLTWSHLTSKYCRYIYRKRFLKENTIALIPNGGYRKREKHSIIAIKWLRLISGLYNLNIQHARNGGEAQILNYKVDGLLRSGAKEVFEFYGCVSSSLFSSLVHISLLLMFIFIQN
jgi:hypothetical protein